MQQQPLASREHAAHAHMRRPALTHSHAVAIWVGSACWAGKHTSVVTQESPSALQVVSNDRSNARSQLRLGSESSEAPTEMRTSSTVFPGNKNKPRERDDFPKKGCGWGVSKVGDSYTVTFPADTTSAATNDESQPGNVSDYAAVTAATSPRVAAVTACGVSQ